MTTRNKVSPLAPPPPAPTPEQVPVVYAVEHRFDGTEAELAAVIDHVFGAHRVIDVRLFATEDAGAVAMYHVLRDERDDTAVVTALDAAVDFDDQEVPQVVAWGGSIACAPPAQQIAEGDALRDAVA